MCLCVVQGVARTLLEHNCLPKIISGTSGGAIVAAVLAICTDEELLSQVGAHVVVLYNGSHTAIGRANGNDNAVNVCLSL